MAEKKEAHHGKQPNQKMKPFIVMQYLQRNTDENHTCSSTDIIDYLNNECGISADRRSIYRDIAEINKAMYMIEQGVDIETAADDLEEYEDEKLIVYDPNRKGFYFRRREYEPNDVRLLVESVYASKFLTKKQADALVDVACSLVSDPQAEKIKHSATYLVDRVKTSNASVMVNIDVINEAMSRSIEGKKHIPEKITFDYMRYSISDLEQHVKSRSSGRYVVSPYALLINDGNYYLLAFDDKSQAMRTYRVDRMAKVSCTGAARDGADAFAEINIKEYSQQVFGMFGGEKKRVQIRFVNKLLDTAVERFGKGKDTFYYQDGEEHFVVATDVEISDQFFAWVCGFGKKAKIIGHEDVVEEFKRYLDDIRKIY